MNKISCLPLLIVASSCAWLGSSTTLKSPPDTKIKKVAIIIAQDNIVDSRDSNIELFFFTKALAEDLSARNMFRFKILSRRLFQHSFTSMELGLLSMELRDDFDAYIICSPHRKGGNYAVELKLVQTNPNKELIYARHSTAFGNSYWLPGSYQQLIQDATEGAFNALQKRLYKIY